MTSASVLRPDRLRASGAITAVLLVLATWSLWPPAEDGLVLYAAGEGAAPVARAFTRETGIPVIVIRLFTGPMLARIAAEGKRPGWAMAWVDGDIPAAALDRAGLLEHDVVPAVAWTPVGRAMVPTDGAWIPTGITLAAVSLRRDGNISERQGMPDPALSGPAYPQLAGIASLSGGWPRARSAMLGWRTSGLEVAPTSPAVVADLDTGRIGRAQIQSSTAYYVATHRPGYYVDVPVPALVMPGVLMVARGLKPAVRRDVDRFTAFIVSSRGQRVRLDSGTVDSFYWPITGNVSAVQALPRLETLTLRHTDPYTWATLQADVTNWFETWVAGR